MYVPRKNPSKQTSNNTLGDDKRKDVGSAAASGKQAQTASSRVDLDAYLTKRDFTGALTLLRLYQRDAIDAIQLPATKEQEAKSTDPPPQESLLGRSQQISWWLAYCHFQDGDYQAALTCFDQLLESTTSSSSYCDTWRLSRACCLYHLQEFEDAEHEALLSTRVPLCDRLLYLLAHRRRKQGAEEVLLDRSNKLSSRSIEDQLAVAFTSYSRHAYQDAVEIYKKLILDHRESSPTALHVYLAMCYFQLDYYDVSLEILAVYLQAHADSFVASNLKACNQFRLDSGVEASQELDTFRKRNPTHPCAQDTGYSDPSGSRAVLQHNHAIFDDAGGSSTEGNIKTLLAPLVDQIDDAKMNLVLAHLHRYEYRQAFELVEDLEEPVTPIELTTKAILHAMIGEQTDSKEHIFLAEKYFHAMGASPNECDTIPGRQCMASYFLLRKEFSDANVYLSSIATYLISSDAFNWNYGMALAATEQYVEAEQVLLRVASEKLRSDFFYCSWLARAYIHNGKNAGQAWELYLGMENTADALKLLKLIANEFYSVKNFYFAVKAFDVLERLDPDPEYWEAKRGACIGFFQQVALGEEPLQASRCEEVLKLLLASKNVVESARMGTIFKKWVHSITS